MTTRTPGRHRAAHTITPFTPLTRAAARGLSTTARRSAIVAAGSGLIVSLLAGPASAAPVAEPDATTAELDAVTLDAAKKATQEVAKAELTTAKVDTAPAVKVAADAKLTIETGTIKVTPAPEPEPEPEPEPVVEAEPAEEEVTATAVAEEPAEEAAPASASGSAIVDIAMQYLGVPYVWAGSTPAGFDCSGFTSYVYAQVGIDLPRTSSEQRYAGTVVSAAEAQPGDLIWTPGHIAIYAGDGMQVEAPVPGETVRYDEIWQDSPTFIRVV
ncbi:cell wall-associated NlpC family hydrolase [Promicromonospora sp. AC04]|uniref:C40 family peptidase n=1 Tax=Promicromonospora sp. AC04 TaxID=2135723 RepID=UPI000D38EF1D|nr:C40 family peptidase [Promicromonospora sp. AC04]PUB31909.1 cell wall-associated NlpC family hydrolase [Promicromonospora sp. AC04]